MADLKMYDVELMGSELAHISAEDLEQATEKAKKHYGFRVLDVRRSIFSTPLVSIDEVNTLKENSEKTQRDDSPVRFRSDMHVELVDSMGTDQNIIDAARVSTGSKGSEKANLGLVNMLVRDRHGSPFEQAVFTFYIECPIFVARQYFRHRVASYNEESGRYRELAPEFYIPNEQRKLRQEGKPAQYTYVEGTEEDYRNVTQRLIGSSIVAYQDYQDMLESGIAREVARMILPLNLYTRFYVTMNARAAMNFLSLRKVEEGSKFDTNPQAEIDQIATQMSELMRVQIPRAMEAFEKYGYVAP